MLHARRSDERGLVAHLLHLIKQLGREGLCVATALGCRMPGGGHRHKASTLVSAWVRGLIWRTVGQEEVPLVSQRQGGHLVTLYVGRRRLSCRRICGP